MVCKILLHGPMGVGKSSTLKALAYYYIHIDKEKFNPLVIGLLNILGVLQMNI